MSYTSGVCYCLFTLTIQWAPERSFSKLSKPVGERRAWIVRLVSLGLFIRYELWMDWLIDSVDQLIGFSAIFTGQGLTNVQSNGHSDRRPQRESASYPLEEEIHW